MRPLPACKASATQLQHQQQHPQTMACLAVCTMTKSLVQRSGGQSPTQMLGRNKIPMLQQILMCAEHVLLFLCAVGQATCMCMHALAAACLLFCMSCTVTCQSCPINGRSLQGKRLSQEFRVLSPYVIYQLLGSVATRTWHSQQLCIHLDTHVCTCAFIFSIPYMHTNMLINVAAQHCPHCKAPSTTHTNPLRRLHCSRYRPGQRQRLGKPLSALTCACLSYHPSDASAAANLCVLYCRRALRQCL